MTWIHPRRTTRVSTVRRTALATIVMAVGLLGVGTAAPERPAGAEVAPSTGSSGPLELTTLTPWVDADGTWTATFNLTAEAPPGTTLAYTVRRPLTGDLAKQRKELDAMWDNGEVPPALLAPVRADLASLTAGSTVTLSVPIRAVSDGSDRAFLPNPGIHPLAIELQAPDGTVLQHFALPLSRAPVGNVNPLRLAVVASATAGPTITTSRGITAPAGDVADLGRVGRVLAAGTALPITVDVTPSLLDALAIDGSIEDQQLLGELRRSANGRSLLRTTWVPIHLDSWAGSGRPSDIRRQLDAGATSIARRLGVAPEQRAQPPDRTLGPDALSSLSAQGIDRMVVSSDQVEGGAPSDSEVFTLTGARGVAVSALSQAVDVQQVLENSTLSPATRAARALTAVAARALSAPSTRQAMVISLDRETGDASTAVASTLAAVAGNKLVTVTPLGDAFDQTDRATTGTRSRRQPVSAAILPPDDPPTVGPQSKQLADLRTMVAGRDSMVDDDPPVPISDLLLTSQHRQLSDAARQQFLDVADDDVRADLGAVITPRGRTFTVTARRSTLPLQFTNRLSSNVRVLVRFESTRITFADGTSNVLTLRPGVNQVPVEVSVRTSGQFRVSVRTVTPDRQVELGRTGLTIRSSAFSGVGLILSAGAIAFLLIWWGRTLRRERHKRRERAAVDEIRSDSLADGG